MFVPACVVARLTKRSLYFVARKLAWWFWTVRSSGCKFQSWENLANDTLPLSCSSDERSHRLISFVLIGAAFYLKLLSKTASTRWSSAHVNFVGQWGSPNTFLKELKHTASCCFVEVIEVILDQGCWLSRMRAAFLSSLLLRLTRRWLNDNVA